jgi:hypothetical protein
MLRVILNKQAQEFSAEGIKKSGSRCQWSNFLYLKIWIPMAEGGR